VHFSGPAFITPRNIQVVNPVILGVLQLGALVSKNRTSYPPAFIFSAFITSTPFLLFQVAIYLATLLMFRRCLDASPQLVDYIFFVGVFILLGLGSSVILGRPFGVESSFFVGILLLGLGAQL
jgi:hypothetical protein